MCNTGKMYKLFALVVLLFLMSVAVMTSCGGADNNSPSESLDQSSGESLPGNAQSGAATSNGDEDSCSVVYMNAEGYNGPFTYDTATGLTLGTPEKAGHDFLGWYADSAYTERIEKIQPGTVGKVTVYAKWQPFTMTLILSVDGEQTRVTLSFGEQFELTLPEEISKPGYNFAGWTYKDQEYSEKTFTFDDPNMISATFTAIWKAQTYTVRFMDGDTEIEAVQIPFAASIDKVMENSQGRVFLGWSTDKNATEPQSGLTVPASDISVYAVWRAKTYHLTVDSGIDIPGLATGSYEYGTVLALPAEVTGYKLTYELLADGKSYALKDSYSVGANHESVSDVSLKVILAPEKVALTFSGEYTGSGKYDFGANLMDVLPQNSNKTIVGWYYDAACTVPVQEKDTVDLEHLVFYAKVSSSKNKIVFHGVNGDTTVSLSFGEKITRTESKVGYEFLGWTDKNGNTVTRMGAFGCDLYPDFKIKTYQLTYDAGGATGTVPEGFVAEFGAEFTLPGSDELVKPYQSFVAWKYNGREYPAGAKVTVSDGDTVIYAIWKGIPIRVDFADWDSTVIYTFDTEVGTPISISGDSVIEGVSEFDRWAYINDIGEECVFENGKTFFTDSTVVRAIYVKSVGSVKTDLTYPAPDSFLFFAKTNASGQILSYSISGHAVEENGNLSDKYVAKLPVNLAIPSTYKGLKVTELYGVGGTQTRGAFNSYNFNDSNTVKFKTVFIPSAISELPNYAFCGSYCEVTFGLNSKCVKFGDYVFSSGMFGENPERNFYNFPTSIQYVGKFSFEISTYGANAPWNWIGQDGQRISELPATLYYIGDYAFSNVGLFDTVHLGRKVTYIGKSAFTGMKTLTSFSIDSKAPVTAIPESCFRGCTGLTSVKIPASLTTLGTWAFSDCSNLCEVDFSACTKLTTIGEMAFMNCPGIKELKLPEGLVSIGRGAFTPNAPNTNEKSSVYSLMSNPPEYNTGLLSKVSFPSTLKVIGECAFAYQSLSSLDLPVALEEIGAGAFMVNNQLTVIDLSNLKNLKKIGAFAFQKYIDYNCNTPFTLVIPAKVEALGRGAFANFCNIDQVKFMGKNTLKTLGAAAFLNVKMLAGDLKLPEGLEKIEEFVFEYTAIQKISFPVSINSIGYYSFAYNTALDQVNFINDANAADLSFGVGSFAGCTALTSISIPCQTAQILGVHTTTPNGIFDGCSSLATVIFEGRNDGKADRALSIGASFVTGCSALKNIYMFRNVLPTFKYGTGETVFNNNIFENCDPSLVFHVLPDMRATYLADEAWAAVFTILKRATIIDDAKS